MLNTSLYAEAKRLRVRPPLARLLAAVCSPMPCINATLRDDLASGLASRSKVDLLNSGIGNLCEERSCTPDLTPFCYQLSSAVCDQHVMMSNFVLFACQLNENDGRCTRGQECSGKDAWREEAWRNAGGLRFSRPNGWQHDASIPRRRRRRLCWGGRVDCPRLPPPFSTRWSDGSRSGAAMLCASPSA